MNRRLALATVVAVALGSAACSSSTSSSTTTTKPTPISTTAPASTTAATPWCATSSLSITAGQPSGAAGHVLVTLTFTNNSTASCVTGGFPGVAGTSASGAQVIQASRVGSSGAMITLAPGQSASVMLSAVNIPSGNATSCPSLTGLVVTPPNTTASTPVIVGLPGCPGLSVNAIQAGA